MASQRNELRISQAQKQQLNQCMRSSLKLLAMDAAGVLAAIEDALDSNFYLEADYSAVHPSSGFDAAAMSPAPESPLDDIRFQIRTSGARPDVAAAALYLAEWLDERGWLDPDALKCCATDEGFGEETAQLALELLQSLEPRGVGGRSLEEVLLLQADDPLCKLIISGHMEILAFGSIRELSAATGAGEDEVSAAAARIRAMSPSPLGGSGSSKPRYIIPEISLSEDLVPEIMRAYPVVSVSPLASRAVSESRDDIKPVMSAQLRDARDLVTAVSMRETTLLRVAAAIVNRQHVYFTSGGPLEALTQAEIASELGLSISTVSRAVSGVSMLYQGRCLELRDLFCSSTSSGTSREQICRAIREVIAGEPPGRPRSDGMIASWLRSSGVSITRRTITKYRNGMGIPAASERAQA